ncbi:hypothetical protein SAMN04488135_105128 [Pollutimonas bauzanensis]|uniref:Uncharacterized protein n=1 Tax=Pollutimonas bauzanensis TaxID=658167 RepID=A0A1M5W803_9BURK|nr:hypothetical protein SAMN04488135_105128 [Pollutimonas bauzanensis]
MSKPSRIALALSSSVLCLGVALAPAAFAAGSAAATKTTHHKKSDKAGAKKPAAAPTVKTQK